MAFTGKYVTTSSENYGEYLKAAGHAPGIAKLLDKSCPTLEFTITDTGVTITTTDSDIDVTRSFTLPFGEQIEGMVTGKKNTMTASKTGADLVITAKKEGGKTGTSTFKITEEGLEEILEADGVKARRTFKKI